MDATTDNAAAASVLACSLCGARFVRGGPACAACPLHAACDLERCPRCGFSFPARSKWVERIRRVLGLAGETR